MMKLILALGACALFSGLSACVVHGHGPCPDEVVIESGHVHSDYCGHYYSHSRWHYSHGHRHGAGCGHVWRSRTWVVID